MHWRCIRWGRASPVAFLRRFPLGVLLPPPQGDRLAPPLPPSAAAAAPDFSSHGNDQGACSPDGSVSGDSYVSLTKSFPYPPPPYPAVLGSIEVWAASKIGPVFLHHTPPTGYQRLPHPITSALFARDPPNPLALFKMVTSPFGFRVVVQALDTCDEDARAVIIAFALRHASYLAQHPVACCIVHYCFETAFRNRPLLSFGKVFLDLLMCPEDQFVLDRAVMEEEAVVARIAAEGAYEDKFEKQVVLEAKKAGAAALAAAMPTAAAAEAGAAALSKRKRKAAASMAAAAMSLTGAEAMEETGAIVSTPYDPAASPRPAGDMASTPLAPAPAALPSDLSSAPDPPSKTAPASEEYSNSPPHPRRSTEATLRRIEAERASLSPEAQLREHNLRCELKGAVARVELQPTPRSTRPIDVFLRSLARTVLVADVAYVTDGSALPPLAGVILRRSGYVSVLSSALSATEATALKPQATGVVPSTSTASAADVGTPAIAIAQVQPPQPQPSATPVSITASVTAFDARVVAGLNAPAAVGSSTPLMTATGAQANAAPTSAPLTPLPAATPVTHPEKAADSESSDSEAGDGNEDDENGPAPGGLVDRDAPNNVVKRKKKKKNKRRSVAVVTAAALVSGPKEEPMENYASQPSLGELSLELALHAALSRRKRKKEQTTLENLPLIPLVRAACGALAGTIAMLSVNRYAYLIVEKCAS